MTPGNVIRIDQKIGNPYKPPLLIAASTCLEPLLWRHLAASQQACEPLKVIKCEPERDTE